MFITGWPPDSEEIFNGWWVAVVLAGTWSLTRFSGHGWCGDHAASWSAV